jgi:glycosyltransferase involved in cell wall biosynthesis
VSASGDQHPLVSVVTPVYNGAEFIRECIESVLAQTYPHWEYVIVENCSDDGTREIALEYAAQDSRIRVATPDEFVGAIENANRALREISPESKYTKVLHADDWLFPECLERMVELAEAHPSVGIVSAYRLEETRVSLTGLPHTISFLSGHEISRSTLLAEPYTSVFGSPTSILLRSDLVRARDPFYNVDNPFQDDLEACYEVLRTSDFAFVHQVLTFTRRDPASPFSYFVRVGAEIPGQIELLMKFASVYLTRRDYQRRLAVLLVRYAKYLLRKLPRARDPEFRSHQRRALSRLRRQLRAADVGAGVALQLRRMWSARRLHPGRG